jgi:hypothetical protein
MLIFEGEGDEVNEELRILQNEELNDLKLFKLSLSKLLLK